MTKTRSVFRNTIINEACIGYNSHLQVHPVQSPCGKQLY